MYSSVQAAPRWVDGWQDLLRYLQLLGGKQEVLVQACGHDDRLRPHQASHLGVAHPEGGRDDHLQARSGWWRGCKGVLAKIVGSSSVKGLLLEVFSLCSACDGCDEGAWRQGIQALTPEDCQHCLCLHSWG